LIGLTIGFIVALGLGVLVSMSRLLNRILYPIVQLLAPIAPIAWIPLGIILFGIGNNTAYFIVFMGTVFVLAIATVAAIQGVNPSLVKTAATLGANYKQQWLYVIIPSVIPQVFTLLRLNLIAAWMAVLAAEMVGLRDGLGAIIMIGRESSNPNLILIGMCLIGISGFIIDSLLLFIQNKFLWWNREVNI
jgi:NitT/TauT family transport system permease protein